MTLTWGGHDIVTLPTITSKETHMSRETLNITVEKIEAGQFRAFLPQGNAGLFAVAGSPSTAIGRVVDAWADANPNAFGRLKSEVVVQNNYNASPDPRPRLGAPSMRLYSRNHINSLMRDLAAGGGRAKIEYEDTEGHVTERVIEPKDVLPSGDVLAYDHLRDAIRRFKPAGIRWAQEVR
jgi:hypothetical protein